jgi:hypothetical protein
MAGGKIKLTKQAAAHRLIQSAVRLCENADDALAAHLVAGSALGLLRDLVAKRGQSYSSRAWAESMFYAARNHKEGKRTPFDDDPQLARVIRLICKGIEDGSLTSAEDVKVRMSLQAEKQLLAHISQPTNFLKHADRDPNNLIDLADVKPIEATMHAITAYAMLFPKDRIPAELEKFVLRHTAEPEQAGGELKKP